MQINDEKANFDIELLQTMPWGDEKGCQQRDSFNWVDPSVDKIFNIQRNIGKLIQETEMVLNI